MIKAQDMRRLEAIEAQLVPRERVVIFTGVPRPAGTRTTDDGSAFIIRTGPDDWDESAGAVVDSVETEEDAFSYTISFDDEVEPSVTADVATPASEPVVDAPEAAPLSDAAPPVPTTPAPDFVPRGYRGRYSWMR